jgi:pimeloyl-ACP methyl ester carboxylesterase
MGMGIAGGEHRASNGIFYRVVGDGAPLLLLHGLMVSGAMFDPLVDLLRKRFRMLIPDLRGHGNSGELPGPYDVPALAADLDTVMAEFGLRATGRSRILARWAGRSAARACPLQMREQNAAGLYVRV